MKAYLLTTVHANLSCNLRTKTVWEMFKLSIIDILNNKFNKVCSYDRVWNVYIDHYIVCNITKFQNCRSDNNKFYW